MRNPNNDVNKQVSKISPGKNGTPSVVEKLDRLAIEK